GLRANAPSSVVTTSRPSLLSPAWRRRTVILALGSKARRFRTCRRPMDPKPTIRALSGWPSIVWSAPNEPAQHFDASFATSFRVELRCRDVVSVDCCRDAVPAIDAVCQPIIRVRGDSRERMNEVHRRTFGIRFFQHGPLPAPVRLARGDQLVPAYVRDPLRHTFYGLLRHCTNPTADYP